MLKGLIRALGAVLIAIALYSVLGFLILPGIGLRIINQQLANYATVPARLDRLEFNPFSLELTLWGFRVGEPGKEYRETLASAGTAAVSGGVTSFVMMPDTMPVVDDGALVDFLIRRAEAQSPARILPAAAITKVTT